MAYVSQTQTVYRKATIGGRATSNKSDTPNVSHDDSLSSDDHMPKAFSKLLELKSVVESGLAATGQLAAVNGTGEQVGARCTAAI